MSCGFALGLVCKATFEEGDKRSDYYKKGQYSPMYQLLAMKQGTTSADNTDPSAAFHRQLATFPCCSLSASTVGFIPTPDICSQQARCVMGQHSRGYQLLQHIISVSNTLIKTDLRTAILSQSSSLAVASSSTQRKVSEKGNTVVTAPCSQQWGACACWIQ